MNSVLDEIGIDLNSSMLVAPGRNPAQQEHAPQVNPAPCPTSLPHPRSPAHPLHLPSKTSHLKNSLLRSEEVLRINFERFLSVSRRRDRSEQSIRKAVGKLC